MKLIYNQKIIQTFDVMNLENGVGVINVCSNGKYLFLGSDNQKIHILKDMSILAHSSSGSGSFESLRTISSNELDKRKKDSIQFGNNKDFISVKYGSQSKKRFTLHDSLVRKSSFSNTKKLLSKGSYENRYQLMRADSINVRQQKLVKDILKIKPLMSISEEKEKVREKVKMNIKDRVEFKNVKRN
jgi:hypothetical protein